MKLNSRGKTAIQAVFDMIKYSSGKPVQLKDIAKRQSLSHHFLEQLFRQLRLAGLVRSIRGPNGGYVIADPVEDITVGAILSAVKENPNFVPKPRRDQTRTEELDRTNKVGLELTNIINKELNKLNLYLEELPDSVLSRGSSIVVDKQENKAQK